jgi:hypothetical protein
VPTLKRVGARIQSFIQVEGSILAVKVKGAKGTRPAGAYYRVRWSEASIGEEWVHQSELSGLLKQTAENLAREKQRVERERAEREREGAEKEKEL